MINVETWKNFSMNLEFGMGEELDIKLDNT